MRNQPSAIRSDPTQAKQAKPYSAGTISEKSIPASELPNQRATANIREGSSIVFSFAIPTVAPLFCV